MFVKIESEKKTNQIKQIQTFTKHFQFLNNVCFNFCLFIIILYVQEEQSNFYQERTFIKSFLKSESLFFSNSEQSGWNHVLKNLNSFPNMNHMNFCEKETKNEVCCCCWRGMFFQSNFELVFYGPGAHFARSDIGKLCAKMHQLDFADH